MGTRIAVMRDGILQQLDRPQVIYDTPTNMFVAGFIGSPAMNFFGNSRLVRGDGGLQIDTGAFHVPVPAAKQADLGKYLDREVVFGIRPEDVHDARYVPSGVDATLPLHATVTVTEPMGAEVNAFIEIGGKEFVGRFDPRTDAAPGQPLPVVLDTSRMHVFDGETEAALV